MLTNVLRNFNYYVIFKVVKKKKKTTKKKKPKVEVSESDSESEDESEESSSDEDENEDGTEPNKDNEKLKAMDDLERKLRERAISSMKKKS